MLTKYIPNRMICISQHRMTNLQSLRGNECLGGDCDLHCANGGFYDSLIHNLLYVGIRFDLMKNHVLYNTWYLPIYIECGMYLSGLPNMDILKPSCIHFTDALAVSKGCKLLSSQAQPMDKSPKHTITILASILKQKPTEQKRPIAFTAVSQ